MAVTPQSLYNQFSNDVLLDLSAKNGIVYEKRRPSKQLQVDTLAQKTVDDGVTQLISYLKKTHLEDLKSTLDTENWASKGNNPNSTKVIAKRLREAIGSQGFGQFLRDNDVSVATLKGILSAAAVPFESEDSEELIKQIEIETGILGLWSFFAKFSTEDLLFFADSLDLEVVSTKKTDIIGCIISHTDLPAGEASQKTKTSKPAIDEKITVKQLTSFYTQATLSRWLKTNGLLETGTKTVLAQRIVDHFKGKEVPKCKPTAVRAPRKEHASRRPRRNVVDVVKDEKLVDAMSEEESDDDLKDEMEQNFADSEEEYESSESEEINEEDLIPVKERKAPAKKAKKVIEAKEAEMEEEEEEAEAEAEEEADAEAEADESEEREEEEVEAEESGEEVESGMEVEDEEDEDFTVEGNVYCVIGNFEGTTAADLRRLIKKAGGLTCVTLTQKCTHLVVVDPEEDDKTVASAKERGLTILGASFVKFLLN